MNTIPAIEELGGLTEQEASRRRREEGPNELPSAQPRSLAAIAFEVVREPMFLLLLGAGLVYLLLGDLGEALLLLVFVFVVIGITLHQERKTENALRALQRLSSPRARVIRGGAQRRVAGSEVVRGDTVIIAEGDRVPADGRVLVAQNLTIDESLLTGESVPVRKHTAGEADACSLAEGAESGGCVYSGTLVVGGLGAVEITQIGAATRVGGIGRSLQTLRPERTGLQVQTRRLVRTLAVLGLLLSAALVVGYGLTRGHWLEGLLAGIALAMSLLPEEFPVVLTIFLALGAWRISARQVLARRMPAVEALGSATVLCVDKTGTITQNRMSVAQLCSPGECWPVAAAALETLPDELHTLVEFSVLASQRDPFDPMEKALHEFGSARLQHTEHLHRDWELVREYPLSDELLAMSHVWRATGGSDYIIAAKGAPEAVADICHLSAEQQAVLHEGVAAMAERGLRVLGVARARFTKRAELPDGQHVFDFTFVGLVGLADPVRPGVAEAVAECYGAGLRVIMITGDYAATAANIAREIGLRNAGDVMTGEELAASEGAELQSRLSEVNVFARVVPEQKLRLVQALQQRGEVVAMTGDGVNDAPALRAANIGVAMGGRGTDVAREAAGLVVLDDDFSSIVAAVRLGRRIFDNLRKAMSYILAIHVPIAGLSLLPVLLRWPLILLPAHIVMMELIIDPACSTVFEAEPEESNVMSRPPRRPQEGVINRRTLLLSLLQGLGVLLVVLAVYLWVRRPGGRDVTATTMAFVTLIVANLGLIYTNISWTRGLRATLHSHNRPLWWVLGGALLLLGALLYAPPLARVMHFRALPVSLLAQCLAAGAGAVLWFELWKLVHRRRERPPVEAQGG